jgi:hypothetical protein
MLALKNASQGIGCTRLSLRTGFAARMGEAASARVRARSGTMHATPAKRSIDGGPTR